jgi:hypothetical protein
MRPVPATGSSLERGSAERIAGSLAAGAILVVAIFSFTVSGHRYISQAILLLGLAQAGWVLAEVVLPKRLRLRPPSLLISVLLVALAASMLAAQIAQQRPEPESFAVPFLLWLASVAAVSLAAFVSIKGSATVESARRFFFEEHVNETVFVLALTIVAFIVRVYMVADHPWPFSGDEASFAMQARAIDDGQNRNMFASGLLGHPSAYWYMLYGHMKVFGDSVFGFRMFGVTLGTLSVLAAYAFLRAAFTRNVAIVGGTYAAAFHFAVHYSRQDLNNIADFLILAAAGALLLKAMAGHRYGFYLATGLVLAAGMYLNVGARIAVPIVGLTLAHAFLVQRDAWREHLRGGVLMGLAFLVAFAPLGLFWYERQDSFSDRINSVGLVQSGWLERELDRGRSQTSIAWGQLKDAVGLVIDHGDPSPHYRSSIPIVPKMTLPFLLLGMLLAVVRSGESRNFYLLCSVFLVILAGAMLIVPPANSQRLVGLALPVVAFTAAGLVWIGELVSRVVQRDLAMRVALVGALILAGSNLHYYFVPYRDGDYFSDFNTRIALQAGHLVRDLPPGTTAYWYGEPNI